MRASWSLSLVPVSRGRPVAISAKIHLIVEAGAEAVLGRGREGGNIRRAGPQKKQVKFATAPSKNMGVNTVFFSLILHTVSHGRR